MICIEKQTGWPIFCSTVATWAGLVGLLNVPIAVAALGSAFFISLLCIQIWMAGLLLVRIILRHQYAICRICIEPDAGRRSATLRVLVRTAPGVETEHALTGLVALHTRKRDYPGFGTGDEATHWELIGHDVHGRKRWIIGRPVSLHFWLRRRQMREIIAAFEQTLAAAASDGKTNEPDDAPDAPDDAEPTVRTLAGGPNGGHLSAALSLGVSSQVAALRAARSAMTPGTDDAVYGSGAWGGVFAWAFQVLLLVACAAAALAAGPAAVAPAGIAAWLACMATAIALAGRAARRQRRGGSTCYPASPWLLKQATRLR